ncbi:MAG: NAD(P)H-dependent oxidoreductase subunit E [Candidatus Sumerlaeota bacterium]|nr:NAD(P)H-dependent oxidoreductase subunit E [Candidatus Sumerlaeota bacterium]
MIDTAIDVGSTVAEIVDRYPAGRESLIPILQDVQETLGYLSEETVERLAEATGISDNEIYGVATFYTQFRFTPPAAHTIRVCQGTACHVRGSHQILRDFEERLHIKAGESTTDGQFGLERVACVGCCALAQVAVVDGKVNAGMTPRRVPLILNKLARVVE